MSTGTPEAATTDMRAPAIDEIVRAQAGQLGLTAEQVQQLTTNLFAMGRSFRWLQMIYQFGIDELLTKVTILRREFEAAHSYSPIEHVRSRLKSVESLMTKIVRSGIEPSIPAVREKIRDIAGVRITCSFESDVYWIAEMLARQPDVTIVQTKDYIAAPKPNGYRSLHLIVSVPVFLSDSTEDVFVELQIRTIAMDFWASVEHKLFYKYETELPDRLVAELDDAARVANELDHRMERLRDEIRKLG